MSITSKRKKLSSQQTGLKATFEFFPLKLQAGKQVRDNWLIRALGT